MTPRFRRPFDWQRDCLADLAHRHFGRIVGRGRGLDLDALEERRLTRSEEVHLLDFQRREALQHPLIPR